MLGAILSNILLVSSSSHTNSHNLTSEQGLGVCLFIGGYRQDCQFNATAASAMASLMAVASASLVIPAALNFAYENKSTEESLNSILILSRGTAIILLILYVFYLNFQLKTHTRLFEESKDCAQKEKDLPKETKGSNETTKAKEAKITEEEPTRVLTPPQAILTLFILSLTIALCAEYLVSTISAISTLLGINRTFIGIIVLPLVGNAGEYISAALAASRKKMDLAVGVALGSSLQIALFVTPSLVLVGWTIGQPMSMSFEPFGAVVFFLSVIVVTGLISDGDSNYLEGAMLVGTYVYFPFTIG
jgi:Ca2+:H+ antiporter